MKKLILSAVAIAALSSCAKDHTCTCTYTNDQPGNVAYTDATILVGTTKSQAKANCFNQTTTTTQGNVTVVSKAVCTLSK